MSSSAGGRRLDGEAVARHFWALRIELGLDAARALSLGENDPASPPILRRMAIELRAVCPRPSRAVGVNHAPPHPLSQRGRECSYTSLR